MLVVSVGSGRSQTPFSTLLSELRLTRLTGARHSPHLGGGGWFVSAMDGVAAGGGKAKGKGKKGKKGRGGRS